MNIFLYLVHTSSILLLCLEDHTLPDTYLENVPPFKVSHAFFENSFFPSTVIEWNKIDKIIRKSESLNIFEKSILKIYTAISKQSL